MGILLTGENANITDFMSLEGSSGIFPGSSQIHPVISPTNEPVMYFKCRPTQQKWVVA
jgi:hypothetical protein